MKFQGAGEALSHTFVFGPDVDKLLHPVDFDPSLAILVQIPAVSRALRGIGCDGFNEGNIVEG